MAKKNKPEGVELIRKYRPRTIKGLIGQDNACRILNGFIKKRSIPHVMLFSGPSGVGKTTCAYIMRDVLECGSRLKGTGVNRDFIELNCASQARGIDTVREIDSMMWMKAVGGKTRVWVLDECHQLTGASQEGLLKILEDTPDHVYFILCSTDPRKLKRTLLTRCTEVKFNSISPKDIEKLLNKIIDKANLNVGEDVCDAIVKAAEGSARQALVLLNIAGQIVGEEYQLNAVREGLDEATVIDLFRVLLNGGTWKEINSILGTIEGNPESIRRQVLACCATTMLRGGKQALKARFVYDCFAENYYDSDKAGLIASCFDVMFQKK